ncbi:MAG: hypothetical protein JNL97_01730 [Verrucomicrobiales bacterium]|nr:hypothetical protein [Verrucomicrobiales bacterium]
MCALSSDAFPERPGFVDPRGAFPKLAAYRPDIGSGTVAPDIAPTPSTLRLEVRCVGVTGVSTGGTFLLGCRIPREGGTTVFGGRYRLVWGPFPRPMAMVSGDTGIRIAPSDSGHVILSVPVVVGVGWEVEHSATLGPDAEWHVIQPAEPGLRLILPAERPSGFFRLRRP